jgi:alpha-galactosidase
MARLDVYCALAAWIISAAAAAAAAVQPATAPTLRNPELAHTPPMGWNSWNAFQARMDEKTIKRQADLMVETGLRDAGYRYFVIDGGWRADQRAVDGTLLADPEKFPSGMRAMCDYVHDRGMKFGLHQPAGRRSARNDSPGSEDFEVRDAELFISWGIDFIKYDQCAYHYPDGATSGAPDLDLITLRQNGAIVCRREAEDEQNHRISAARPREYRQCSGGAAITSIGIEDGALEVPVDVPDAGEVELEIGFVYVFWGQGTDRSNDMTLYVSADGTSRQKLVIDHPAAQGREYPRRNQVGSVTCKVQLHSGRNVLRLDNPTSCEEILRRSYFEMAQALSKSPQPILFSISGSSRPWLWGPKIAQMWRMNTDLADRWDAMPNSILQTLDRTIGLEQYWGHGSWMDPDLLHVGAFRPAKGAQARFAMDETAYRAHFSLWCVLGAPLFASVDLESTMRDPRISGILLNREAIAIDQDPLGERPCKMRDDGETEIWVRPLSGGARAALLLNRGDAPTKIVASPHDIGLPEGSTCAARDIWAQRDLVWDVSRAFDVPAHGVVLLRVTPAAP